jgi:hypothetical protein
VEKSGCVPALRVASLQTTQDDAAVPSPHRFRPATDFGFERCRGQALPSGTLCSGKPGGVETTPVFARCGLSLGLATQARALPRQGGSQFQNSRSDGHRGWREPRGFSVMGWPRLLFSLWKISIRRSLFGCATRSGIRQNSSHWQ